MYQSQFHSSRDNIFYTQHSQTRARRTAWHAAQPESHRNGQAPSEESILILLPFSPACCPLSRPYTQDRGRITPPMKCPLSRDVQCVGARSGNPVPEADWGAGRGGCSYHQRGAAVCQEPGGEPAPVPGRPYGCALRPGAPQALPRSALLSELYSRKSLPGGDVPVMVVVVET